MGSASSIGEKGLDVRQHCRGAECRIDLKVAPCYNGTVLIWPIEQPLSAPPAQAGEWDPIVNGRRVDGAIV